RYYRCWLAPAADRCRRAQRDREGTRAPSPVEWTRVWVGLHFSQPIPPLFLVGTRFFSSLQYLQCISGSILRSGVRPVLANLDRGFENGPNREYSSQLVRGYGGQAHGCDASARRAIRISAELAWSDLCAQV